MSKQIEPKICDKCHKPCQSYPTLSRPSSSEWYCPACHLSYNMSRDEIIYFTNQVQRNINEQAEKRA